MKNHIILIAASLVTSCAFANPFAGPYVTGGLGGISTDFQIQANTDVIQTGGAYFSIPNNSNSYANRLIGTLGLGYAYGLTNFIIGIQGDANFFNTNITQANSSSEITVTSAVFINSTMKAQLKNSYDILFRPGWLMDRSTLLYGLIGASFGDFHVSQSATFTETDLSTIIAGGSAQASLSSWRTGFTVGLGVQQYIWKNISAALEYAHTNYGNLSLTTTSSGPILVGPFPVAALNANINQIKASTNTILLRLFFTFA